MPSEVSELEYQLEGFKEAVARKEMAIRLSKNRDFRQLVLEGFCRDEAARYVQQSINPALQAVERADALGMAQASGHLKNFLSVTIQMGNTAEANISELEEHISQARAEEGAA